MACHSPVLVSPRCPGTDLSVWASQGSLPKGQPLPGPHGNHHSSEQQSSPVCEDHRCGRVTQRAQPGPAQSPTALPGSVDALWAHADAHVFSSPHPAPLKNSWEEGNRARGASVMAQWWLLREEKSRSKHSRWPRTGSVGAPPGQKAEHSPDCPVPRGPAPRLPEGRWTVCACMWR